MRSVRLLKNAHYHDDEVDSDGTWALSYGDMITLLLSFFVIFFTTDFQKEKVEKLNRHLSFQLENAVPLEPPQPKASSAGPMVRPELKLPDIQGVALTTQAVGDSVVVTFQATSFYGSGQVTLNAVGEKLLREFAERYLPYAGNYRLAVKGFTDKRPVARRLDRFKKYDDNLELSALRSLSAMRILQAAGIPLNRMEIAGAGELEAIDQVLPRKEGLTQAELDAFSRTIVLVVHPDKESWL